MRVRNEFMIFKLDIDVQFLDTVQPVKVRWGQGSLHQTLQGRETGKKQDLQETEQFREHKPTYMYSGLK